MRRQALITHHAADIDRAHRFVRAKLELAQADMRPRERRRLKRMIDDRDDVCTLSQFHVAKASQLAMIEALWAHFDAHRHEPDFRYWLGTFCLDEGVVHVGDGFLDLRAITAFKLAVYKALRDQGVHAVLAVEIEILARLRGELSARFMYHIHAACWRHGAPLRPRKLAKAIRSGKRFRNSLGARPVVFTTNKWTAADGTPSLCTKPSHPAPTDATVAGLAAYVTKWPACIKVRRAIKGHPGRHRLKADQAKNSGPLVLALTEARSRLSVLDAVQGVGEGKAVRKAWKSSLERRLK